MLGIFTRLFGIRHSEEERSYRDFTWKAIDRLIPEDSKKDSVSWEKFKTKALEEINEQILYARSVGKSPFQVERERVDRLNKELKQEHELLTKGYALTEADYRADIYPNLCRFSFFPGRGEIAWGGEQIESVVYDFSSPEYRISSEARDKLIGKCDVDAISVIVKTMRRNYEKLRGAELAGHEEVRLLTNHKACSTCNGLGESASVHTLLAEYRNSSIKFPHEVPWEDEVQYCEGPHLIAVVKGPV